MKTTTHYIYSPDTGVHTREGYAGIRYSDGAEIEERLLRNVKACTDVSDGSTELNACIADWPSEYHFSPMRANLLRPFSFAGQRVLELGCGCGALTRFLGENGAEVTAVEGSPMRAAIAAARCRDLPNVRVYCDNLANFQSDADFDAVTLIGVLEYSRMFIFSDDPVQDCLKAARSFLKDDGTLYVAIENQLGLKYFNGCAEDHTGIPYFGINDRYSTNTPVTFGKKELAERLQAAGFAQREFFFPFPDYKLPEMILSETALDHPVLQVGDLLCRSTSRDYGKNSLQSFSEPLAWRALARNGLIGDLANSFLVRACKHPAPAVTDWHVRSYSVGRMREFSTENVIRDGVNELLVEKRALFPSLTQRSRFEHITGTADYVAGQLYLVDLQRIIADGGGFSEIETWARPWLQFLNEHQAGEGMLPGMYVDCIPSNLIRDGEGRFHYIDVEWRANSNIPFIWVAARGLIIAISDCPAAKALGSISYRQFAATVLQATGCPLTDEDWVQLGEWEDALRIHCYGKNSNETGFIEQIGRIGLPWTTAPTCLDTLEQARAELGRIKGSYLWRLIRPLRRAYGQWHRLMGKA